MWYKQSDAGDVAHTHCGREPAAVVVIRIELLLVTAARLRRGQAFAGAQIVLNARLCADFCFDEGDGLDMTVPVLRLRI